jgi:excisionase family DNA binding protein
MNSDNIKSPPMPSDEPLLKAGEVAEFLRLSGPKAVHALVRRGVIRGYRVGRILRFRRSDVEAALKPTV